MNLGVMFRAQLQALSTPVLKNFDALVTSLTTWGQAEHNDDGTHGAVTAESVDVSGVTSLIGKTRLGMVTYTEPGATGGTVNNLSTAGIARTSVLRISATSSPLIVTGIDALGRVPGDLLLVLNVDDSLAAKDVWLTTEAAGSVATNRFVHTTASPGGGASANVVVNGGRGVWLIYDLQNISAATTSGRWRILDPTS